MGSSSIGFNASSIPKLEGTSNFQQWKVICMSSLQSSGVWKFVIWEAVPPLQDPAEREYSFQDRLENYHSRAAQARNIILCSCSSHIQQTLVEVLTAQACWDKLLQTYGAEGLIHIQATWAHFARFQYQGEEIAEFCLKYHVALDRCHTAGIGIEDTISVLHFITILDTHFDHWTANKRDQMRRDPLHLPTLDTLINEITNEARRKKDHPILHVAVPSPKRQCHNTRAPPDECSHCGLIGHLENRCFYKHPHLRKGD